MSKLTEMLLGVAKTSLDAMAEAQNREREILDALQLLYEQTETRETATMAAVANAKIILTNYSRL